MHAWLLSNTSSSRVLGSTRSWAWNACVHVRSKQAVQQASRCFFFPACTNGGKAGMGQGLGRTSAFAPRSPICLVARNTFSAEHATAHDSKYPHPRTLSCEYRLSGRPLHSSYSFKQCKTAQYVNKPSPLTTHACRSTQEAPRQAAPCTASPDPATATACSSSQRHRAIREWQRRTVHQTLA